METDGRIKISPRARNLAERAGVDYRMATPTGPEGRIIERDIRELIEKGPVANEGSFRGKIYGYGWKGSISDWY